MILQPFRLFTPFAEHLDIALCVKVDGISSDDDTAALFLTSRFASAEQVHGQRSAVIHTPIRRMKDVDGLMTDERDLTLSVRVADCQSFVFHDPTHHAIGVLHAGWRGILAGAIPNFIELFQKTWNSDPSVILVGAGPSLCQTCAEFTDPAAELPGIDPRFFDGRHVDLRGIADQQLLDAGILRDHIERSGDCTKCRSDLYWSYRGGDREAVKEGHTNVLACTVIR